MDATLIGADANRQKGIEGARGLPEQATDRVVYDYLAVLDDAAFGGVSGGDTQVYLAGRSSRTLDQRT